MKIKFRPNVGRRSKATAAGGTNSTQEEEIASTGLLLEDHKSQEGICDSIKEGVVNLPPVDH